MSRRFLSQGGAEHLDSVTPKGTTIQRNRYRQARTWKAKLDAYTKLGQTANANTRSFLARAALELSLGTSDSVAAGDLLNEAVTYNLQAEASAAGSPAEVVKTAMFRHNLPLMLSVHAERETPSDHQIEMAHRGLAAKLYKADAQSHSLMELKKVTDYFGDASEAFVLIALQRYSTERAEDKVFTAIPSLLSEDIGGKKGSTTMNRWDVSVYGQQMDAPEHKIQVKWNTDNDRVSHWEYSPDISVVDLKHGLSLSSHPLKLGRLVTEAAGHVINNPPPHDAEFFARRQDLLLQQIGAAV